jgi:hypothetical protein
MKKPNTITGLTREDIEQEIDALQESISKVRITIFKENEGLDHYGLREYEHRVKRMQRKLHRLKERMRSF